VSPRVSRKGERKKEKKRRSRKSEERKGGGRIETSHLIWEAGASPHKGKKEGEGENSCVSRFYREKRGGKGEGSKDVILPESDPCPFRKFWGGRTKKREKKKEKGEGKEKLPGFLR